MRLFKLCLAVMAVTAISTASASTSNQGSIGNITVQNGKMFFEQRGSRTAAPTCSTQNYRWVFDAQSPDGQAKAAVLLSAYALHKQIYVSGTGACSDWSDTESVDYIILIDNPS